MGHNNFHKDSQDEAKLKTFLKNKNRDKNIFKSALNENIKNIEWIEGNHKEYDHTILLEDGKQLTAEWKMDLLCKNTGNCYVEYWCRGNPSGIDATTSDYWAQAILSKIFYGKVRFGIWKTSDFIKLVKTKMFRDGVPGGDKWHLGPSGRAAVGYLIKEEKLFDEEYLLLDKTMSTKTFLKETGIVINDTFKIKSNNSW